MPTISAFYGITIFINFSEHNPPHFHAWHGERKGVFSIKTGGVDGMKNIKIRRVKPLEDFKLDLTFSNGRRKIYDMKPQIWGPAFEPMKGNMDFFRKAFVWMGTVAWPENIDIAPEELYENGVVATS